MRCVSFAVVLSGASLAASLAGAQDSPSELARRQLLNEAVAARSAGDHARALDRARRAGQLRMHPSVRLMIAQESEALLEAPGQEALVLVSLAAAESCVAEGTALPQFNHREETLAECRAIASRLRARIATVELQPPSPLPPGLQVRLGGAEVPPALWGVGYPVLPGRLTVEATTPDGRAFRREVVVAAGASETIALELQAPVAPPRPTEGTEATTTRTATRPERGRPGGRVVSTGASPGPWVLAGAGALSVISGAVLFALQQGAASERAALCPDDGQGGGACADASTLARAQGYQSDERTFNAAGWVFVGVGSAAVLGGLVWALLPRTSRERGAPRGLTWGASPLASGAVFTLGGAL